MAHADYSLVTTNSPATAGEVVLIFCTGLGPTTPAAPTGVPAPGVLAPTNFNTTVTLGGKSAEVLYSGLAPYFVGLYQVNLRVPAGIASGPANLTVAVNDAVSQTVQIAIN